LSHLYGELLNLDYQSSYSHAEHTVFKSFRPRNTRQRRCREDCVYGSDRLEDWQFRDCECADTAYGGASRPCTALLGHRVRKWNARNIIALPITV